MAIKDVLGFVQDCLSILDSDEVDSISDTTESLQVATLLSDIYYEFINRQDWQWLKRAVTLDGGGDISQPTKLSLPSGIKRITTIWYNVSDDDDKVENRKLQFRCVEDFLDAGSAGISGDKLIRQGNEASFYVKTDRPPTFYTVFDDKTIFCDSYQSTVESTLVNAKVSAVGFVIPPFEVRDGFVPDLPEHMVSLLQHSLNSAASIHFNKAPLAIENTMAERQLSQARKDDKSVAKSEGYYSNQFGRR